MKKNIAKKLALSTETLVSLQSDALAGVAGGNQITNPTQSVRGNCPSRVLGQTCFLCVPKQAE
jgi:hypothetical protein